MNHTNGNRHCRRTQQEQNQITQMSRKSYPFLLKREVGVWVKSDVSTFCPHLLRLESLLSKKWLIAFFSYFFSLSFFIISRRGDNQLFIFQPLCLSRTFIEVRNCLRNNNMKHSLTRRGDEIHGSLPFMKEINFFFLKKHYAFISFYRIWRGFYFWSLSSKKKTKAVWTTFFSSGVAVFHCNLLEPCELSGQLFLIFNEKEKVSHLNWISERKEVPTPKIKSDIYRLGQ